MESAALACARIADGFMFLFIMVIFFDTLFANFMVVDAVDQCLFDESQKS